MATFTRQKRAPNKGDKKTRSKDSQSCILTAGAPAGSSVSAVQTVTVTATDGASALAGQLELSYSGVVIGGALTAPFTSTSATGSTS